MPRHRLDSGPFTARWLSVLSVVRAGPAEASYRSVVGGAGVLGVGVGWNMITVCFIGRPVTGTLSWVLDPFGGPVSIAVEI